jgi:hypothetical protein
MFGRDLRNGWKRTAHGALLPACTVQISRLSVEEREAAFAAF